MSSRNMKDSNKEIFRILDNFCSVRGDPIQNSDKGRWISTEVDQQAFLKYGTLSEVLGFSPTRAVARFDLGTKNYFFTVGFDHCTAFGSLTELDLNGSILTALLAEVKPRPRASTILIREYVEASDKSTPGYAGHDYSLIGSLFPPIKGFGSENLSKDETWRTFFLLCVEECRHGESWIDEEFASTLRSICELQFLQIPFRMLCRSVFDSDPATMFLALYRCLESLYAYTSAQDLIQALDLKLGWADVATALEDKLNWHPREESSLAALLSNALDHDLKALFSGLGEPVPMGHIDLAAVAGRRMYRFRNGLVHFRPYHHQIDYSNVNWNRLCITMAQLVWHIYSDVFAS